jgi:hypothetical protein
MKTTELIPGRVSLTYGQGVILTDEGNEACENMIHLMNAVPQVPLYHHIIHLLVVESLAINFTKLLPPATRELMAHPRTGWLLIISTNKAFTFITDVMLQITKVRHRHFQTLEEAIEFLKEVDSTIDWSQMDENVTGVS